MAGIYIHVPFCVSRCGYCDFYKTTNFEDKGRYVNMLLKEIDLRVDYLSGELIETIYFGGGTPSVLALSQFKAIFLSLNSKFVISKSVEITVECNPDDVTYEFLLGLLNLGVNRLSIGIQSFDDNVLRFMQRRHNGVQALDAIGIARKVGFENISIDLIYGLPNLLISDWQRNLEIALSLNVEHISAYHLTYEKNTVFDKLLKKGLIKEVDEDSSVQQFNMLLELLNVNGYEQYEVSNFCKNNKYSDHNSNYWLGVNYLGLGPSAHSYNGNTRSWNISDLNKYIKSINQDILPLEKEQLSDSDKYNELIMVGLRTKWGVNLDTIKRVSSPTLLAHFEKLMNKHIHNGNIFIEKNRLFLTPDKKMISDNIISDLFYVE